MRKLVYVFWFCLIVLLFQSKSALAQGTVQTKLPEKEAIISSLEGKIFWLGLFSAFALISPLPIAIYHIRRSRQLTEKLAQLQSQIREQEGVSARLDSLLSRNEKLETENKHLQERFRVSVRNIEEKNQELIDKLKADLQQMEAENRRISGLLMIKDQVSKKL